MRLSLSGKIQSRKILRYGKDICYGLTRADKDNFRIYISELALKDINTFSETMLHELLHLWFFILNGASDRWDIPEAKQHEVLEEVMPMILSRTEIIRNRKRKGK